MKPQIICLPVALQRYIDFTPVALRQRELARIMAIAYGAELYVLTVEAPVGLVAQLDSTEEKLARFIQPLEDARIPVRPLFQKGRPSDEILALIDGVGVDLVILGSHSKRGPLDVGIGSTAAVITRQTDAAVLLVRPTMAEAQRTHDLMVPNLPWVFPYP